jgi:hypothetical protein
MSFIQAHLEAGHTPLVRELPVAVGEAFVKGALLIRDGAGAWAECGADPAAIGAVALSNYQVDNSGFSPLGRTEFPPGFMQGMAVQGEQVFHAEYVGALPAVDGGSYGVTRGVDLVWRVDFGKGGGDARVRLVGRWTDAPINRNRVMVSILPANVQVI